MTVRGWRGDDGERMERRRRIDDGNWRIEEIYS
jgi:hypothetical protein